jgi:hypothetical protein
LVIPQICKKSFESYSSFNNIFGMASYRNVSHTKSIALGSFIRSFCIIFLYMLSQLQNTEGAAQVTNCPGYEQAEVQFIDGSMQYNQGNRSMEVKLFLSINTQLQHGSFGKAPLILFLNSIHINCNK